MKCYQPITLSYQEYLHTKDYRLNENGYKIHSNFGAPIKYRNNFITVGCGKCLACLSQKSNEWAMRLSHELTNYDNGKNSMFITLTYAKAPENYSLVKKDLQDFFKRLRYYNKGKKIKYLACGEYGMNYGRPHYHAIICGLSYFSQNDKDTINKAWKIGHTHIGVVTAKSINYCVKYMSKDIRLGFNRKEYFKMTGKEKPFRLVSLGMGKDFCLKIKEHILKHMRINYEGFDISVPRTYLRWLVRLGYNALDKAKLYAQEHVHRVKEKLSKLYSIPLYVEHSVAYRMEPFLFPYIIRGYRFNPALELKEDEIRKIKKQHYEKKQAEYVFKKKMKNTLFPPTLA